MLQGGGSFVSADIDGNICIWDVETCANADQQDDPFFAEILVNMNELHEKNENLDHLNSRIAEMAAEHAFEILQKDNFYSERIKDIEQNNAHQIQTLEKRIEVRRSSTGYKEGRSFPTVTYIFSRKVVEEERTLELNRMQSDIAEMKQQHNSQIDEMESHFEAKLLYEFQRYDDLRQEMEKMKDNYEKFVAVIRVSSFPIHFVRRLAFVTDS